VRRLVVAPARATAFILAGIVALAVAVALAWVFYVPILEAPDETVHFEYSTALYSAGGLVAPRDAARINVPQGRSIPDPRYLEDAAAVAVIAEKPDVKAPAGYGSAAYYRALDQGSHRIQPANQLVDPPLLRYYPFGYYLIDAAAMGVVSLATSSPVALFFAARALSAALLIPSLILTYFLLRRLRCSRRLSLALTAVVGLFPMTSMMSSSVQSDNLSFTLVVLVLVAALEVREKPHHRTWIAVLGLALGALLVTKVHYFAITAVAVGAMLVTQRLERRDARGWPVELGLLLTPSIVLEAVQLWLWWGSPALIAPAQLGDVPNYRSALAGGLPAIASYIANTVSFTFLDNTFGREFGSFWGVFGWVDTPLVLGSAGITAVVWLLIAGISMLLLVCTLVRIGRVAWRLFLIARRGRPLLALRMAFSNPVANAYFLLALFLFTVEGYPGVQGRYYLPLLPGVFWVALKYAPRALPGKFGPALFRLQVVGLVAYTAAGAVFAFPTLTARYYAHGRDLVPVARETLQEVSTPGLYAITRVRLPEATLGVGSLPTGRVGVLGWAVDQGASAPARTVFIDVDGQPFQQAVYGDDSPAAVTALGSDRYARCGFDAILDTTKLTKGSHQLTVRVVSADGMRLYAPGPPVEFIAGISLPPGSS
jgi:predicted membrane protein DUF2142